MPIPVILDCDPGHDDAIAILLARAHSALELLAVTTVAGNAALSKTTRNAGRVCALAGITDVPLAAGCDRALAGELVRGDDVHGESGLDGLASGGSAVPPRKEHAVELMHRVLAEHPDPVTVLAVGPLTNVATLFRRHPGDRERVREVVIMGGSTGRGNYTPYAEFNIAADPEAAAEVVDGGVRLRMHGLNVTYRAQATPDILARIRELGTPLAEVCVELLNFYRDRYLRIGCFDGPPLHDPVAVAAVIDAETATYAEAPLGIEVRGEHTRGASVVDLDGRTGRAPNAAVALDLDRDRFWPLVIDAIAKLG